MYGIKLKFTFGCWKYPKFRLYHKNQTFFKPLLNYKSEFRLFPKNRARVGGLALMSQPYWVELKCSEVELVRPHLEVNLTIFFSLYVPCPTSQFSVAVRYFLGLLIKTDKSHFKQVILCLFQPNRLFLGLGWGAKISFEVYSQRLIT